MNKLTDTFVLSNGVQVPCVGYGTYLTPDGEIAKNSVMEAINVGYRHIDTAFAYGNEKAVGEGIKASGVKREDVFVTTKHWVTMRGYEKATRAIDINTETWEQKGTYRNGYVSFDRSKCGRSRNLCGSICARWTLLGTVGILCRSGW